jgi:hypothetical protein
MSRETTALFEPDDACREVKLVMHDQYFFWHYFEEMCQRADRFAAFVHVGIGDQKFHFLTINVRRRDLAKKFFFFLEGCRLLISKPGNEPDTNVVPGSRVLCSRVSNANHQL